MKLTIETLKKLIKEELEAVHEAITGRTIYASGPVKTKSGTYIPKEKGSRIRYDRDPFLELDPKIQKSIPKGSSAGSELQAYELQRAMDPDFGEEDYPDFTGMSPEEEEIHKDKAEQRAAEEFAQGVERQGEDSIDSDIEEINNEIHRIFIKTFSYHPAEQTRKDLEAKIEELRAKRNYLLKLAFSEKI